MAGWEEAGHLPNLRPGRQPPSPPRLPRQRRGTTPQMIGRYPDYDVLAPGVVETWDETTRAMVLERVRPSDQLRFFRPEEVRTVHALCNVLMAQDDEPRVPLVQLLDRKYAEGRLDGYRYADMPPDPDTWHLVLEGLDATARERYGREGFADLDSQAQHALCEQMKDGVLRGGPWDRLNVGRAWSVVVRGVVSEFYSHPWAWNEIGFGGPAYPRGFMRFGALSTLEPFERPDRREAEPTLEEEEERER